MSSRLAKNIEYNHFLTSVSDEHDEVSCNKLEIPEFQRNYVWKSSNIKDLFDSIKENDPNYYLGNIVVVKDGAGRAKIVDGQQRLVSLSLIAKKLIEKTNDSQSKESLRKIIWADTNVVRILFQKSNLKELYENLLYDSHFDEHVLDDTQNILFRSFQSISRECDALSDVDTFIKKFLSLEFVVIVSPSDEDAYQLFEGLNSTGLSLSAVELTKNSILGKIKNLNSLKVDEAVLIWTSIEKSFEDTNIVWFNKFLRHHWFSQKGYVSNGNLFREIKLGLINKDGVSVETLFEYLNELKRDSALYISFRTANLNKSDFSLTIRGEAWSNVERINNFIKNLGLDQVYSVLLSLYKYGNKESEYFNNGETFQCHIKKLWYFLLIVRYTKVSPSLFERDFAGICKKIKNESYSDFKKSMKVFFENISEKITGLEQDFSSALNDSIDYSIDDRQMVRFLLEEYLTTAGDGSDSNIETEHIVPENTLEDWINVENKEDLLLSVGKLGNLTLLKNTLNSDAGHKSFDEKFNVAYSKSKFSVNNNLKKDWGDKFNSKNPLDQAIYPRGQEIGNVLYNKYLSELVK